MRIVIAPQGFKGTLNGTEAAEAIALGVRRVVPGAALVLVPVADGGHGTLDAVVTATRGRFESCRVMGPMRLAAEARWGVLGDGVTAVVEMAEASGLTLVPEDKRDPMHATTYGTGQLIKAALDAGHRQIIVGVGGSATNDGGAGAVQVLGVRLVDSLGVEIGLGAAGLLHLAGVSLSGVLPSVHEASIKVATDVSNPLCGPQGAAMTYAIQKGARPEQLPVLDTALATMASVVERDLGVHVRDMPGAGAAGGLAAGLVAFLGAKLVGGAKLVCDAVGLDAHLTGADLVITGEGRIDGQTLFQKAPLEVAHRARAQSVPCVAIGGGVTQDAAALLAEGTSLLEACAPVEAPQPSTRAEAVRLLADAAERSLQRAIGLGLIGA